jgi:hypothetical protein
MPKRVVRKRKTPPTTVTTWLHEWKQANDMAKTFTARKNELRDRLMEVVESFGETDADGHVWFDLPEAVDGFTRIKRERRVSQSFDYEGALELVQSKNLDACVKLVPQLDEDAFMVAVSDGVITEEEYSALIEAKVSYAFKPK